ncbi:HlyD family efflux transporter periplasmic adaptor subunit [Vibrio sp. 10N.261.46.E12]|uniref:HlyD family efflux transporter periplasmic adaptor subunit n=1 Tax=unclassified Vibrio TaxID=2614977 RepID=UPI0018E4671F|nr:MULTISPECIES: HlyD family efflux transporter periplasmic adaptor subunit [unclassified Vibrio]
MLFNGSSEAAQEKKIYKLSSMHLSRYSLVVGLMFTSLVVFTAWSRVSMIDQVARATGEVIASSRVQEIKSVDGGVLSELFVREGDRVNAGDVLARLDQTRFGASVKEIEAKIAALKAKAVRLRAEVTDKSSLTFPSELESFPEIIEVENSLFKQRRDGLKNEVRVLRDSVSLAKEELSLIKELKSLGDVNRSEEIRAQKSLNEAETKLITRRNRFLEDASLELTKTEDDLSQNKQVLTQRRQQLNDSVFRATTPGIVKNVQVTTIGGVLARGEELMQIIPVNDDLIIEAKVIPADIALVRKGLDSMIRLDPFDYTIFGGVKAKVVYVSPDTLKEQTAQGEEIYYRVHLVTSTTPVVTTTGKELEILPGMTAQIDIKTGERSLFDYLLKPIRKTLSESLGER